jgi:hypothetical protein
MHTTNRRKRTLVYQTICRLFFEILVSFNLKRVESKANPWLDTTIGGSYHPIANFIFQIYGTPTVCRAFYNAWC